MKTKIILGVTLCLLLLACTASGAYYEPNVKISKPNGSITTNECIKECFKLPIGDENHQGIRVRAVIEDNFCVCRFS